MSTILKKRVLRWVRGLVLCALLVPIGLLAIAVLVMTTQQEHLVARLLVSVNEGIAGTVSIERSHIAPFADFPRISIDLEGVEIFEDVAHGNARILRLNDVYLGFDLLTLLRGTPELRSLRIEGGDIALIEHTDGTLNLANALAPQSSDTQVSTERSSGGWAGPGVDLAAVSLRDIHLEKYSEAGEYRAVVSLTNADLSLLASEGPLQLLLNAALDLTVEHRNVPTFFRDRHLELSTTLSLHPDEGVLRVARSQLTLEEAVFRVAGSVDLRDDLALDLTLEGDKPNFDLFLAFAPPELAPVLAGYQNEGRIYFAARAQGPSINGRTPAISVDFGCEDGILARPGIDDSVRNLNFRAHYTNGAARSAATSTFTLTDFTADPAAGFFRGDLVVNDFTNPDVDLRLDADFDLDFLARFLGLEELFDLAGRVRLKTAFRELIDLEQPEESLLRIGESYATTLAIEDLSFRSPDWPDAFEDIHVDLNVQEGAARLHTLRGRHGNASIAMSGSLSDLRALLSQLDTPLDAELQFEIVDWRTAVIRERLSDLVDLPDVPDIKRAGGKLKLSATGAALALQAGGLPVGRLQAKELYADLAGGAAQLSELDIDIQTRVDSLEQFRITGRLGESRFSAEASLDEIQPLLTGAAGVVAGQIHIQAPLVQFADLMSLLENPPLPDDWHEERIKDFSLQLRATLGLGADAALESADIDLMSLAGTLSVHEMPLRDGRGRVHWDAAGLTLTGVGLGMGESSLVVDYVPSDADQKKPARLTVHAPVLDFDALTLWSPPESDEVVDHDAGFSLFDLPFPHLQIDLTAGRVNYHRMLIEDLQAQLITREDHSGRVEILDMRVADGHMSMQGDFDGEQRERIRFQSRLTLDDIDLDRLLFKFENFGQDHLISENLHGRLSGNIEGLLVLHADLTPIIDQSSLAMEVRVRDGLLENFTPLEALSDYFRDRNLNKLRFGELSNRLELKNGVMEIPTMTINSSLGFLEVSGQQALAGEAEYLIRVPWRMVTGAAFSRLFGGRRRADVDPDTLDEIQYRDEQRRVRFLTLRVASEGEEWRVALGEGR